MACKICNWNKGNCHGHHIIPKKHLGANENENIIELCPNCHSEAHIDWQHFNKKHNLIGKYMDQTRINAINSYIKIYLEHFPTKEIPRLTKLEYWEEVLTTYLSLKFEFTHLEAISVHIGVYIQNLLNNYGNNSSLEEINNGVITTNKKTYPEYQKEEKEFKMNAKKMLQQLITVNTDFKLHCNIYGTSRLSRIEMGYFF